jgi:hypothetical protein
VPGKAKAYITLVIASGSLILLFAAGSWSSTNLKPFALYLGLAALASTLKVRIPGIESTISPNFLFLLLAICVCQFSEVVAISLVAALVQSLSPGAKRARLVQVAFSAAALVLSSAAAYMLSRVFLSETGWESSVGRVILAGCVYFPLNSILVSVVIGLVAEQPLKRIWSHCYEWVFPYFMGGIAFAGLVSGAYVHSSAWKGAFALIPAAALAHVYFLQRPARQVMADASPRDAQETHEDDRVAVVV